MQRILATGVLEKDRCGYQSRSSYLITYLNQEHLPMVMDLQRIIVQNLSRSDLLQSFSQDFMKRHMGHQGVVMGVFVDRRLAAFRNIYYPAPKDKEWNLGIDLNLAEKELNQVANLQMVCVHPRFRGNALALKMNHIALDLLRRKGSHPHICATVSPHNTWNISILLASGFVIARLKSKYNGKLRYIVYQNLRSDFLFDDNSAFEVRMDDFRTQKKMFESNFYGVALKQHKRIDGQNPASCFNLVFKYPSTMHLGQLDSSIPFQHFKFQEAMERSISGAEMWVSRDHASGAC